MFSIFLQTPPQDILLKSDKIYSVLAIILLVFISLIGYLFFTDKKISKLESQINRKEIDDKK